MEKTIPISDNHEHIIQMDDKITISVWGHDELGVGSSFSVYSSTLEQGKYISIDKSGEITLPLIGKVKLEGLTAREADLYIRQLYSKYVKNPIVYLRVLSHSVTVLGEVSSPGNYLIDKQQKSLLELIGDAGGFSKYANKREIKILRKHPDGELEEIDVDLTNIETLYTTDLALRSRDIIYVPERKTKELESVVSGKVVPIVGVLGSLALIWSLTRSAGS
ncbi:MAG: polysaccharide biosynthesis/export family protein [Bacteroidota bacterium]